MYSKTIKRHPTILNGLIIGAMLLLFSGFAYAQAYEGPEFCKECHEDNYREWQASGHPYKLMKASSDPFTKGLELARG